MSASASASTSQFRPEDSSYRTGELAVWMLPGIIMAVLTILAFPTILILRKTCCRARRGKEFTPLQVNLTKAGMVAVALLMVVAFVLGYLGNGRSTAASRDFFDELEQSTRTIVDLAAEINANIQAAGQTPDPEIEARAAEIEEAAAKTVDDADKIIGYRSIFLHVAFGVPILASCFGIVSILMNKGIFAKVFLSLAFLGLIANWVSFGVHMGIVKVSDDICADLDTFIADVAAGRTDTQALSFVDCVQSEEAANAQREAIDAIEAAAAEVNASPYGTITVSRSELSSPDESTVRAAVDDLKAQIATVRSNVSSSQQGTQQARDATIAALDRASAGAEALVLIGDIKSCRSVSDILSSLGKPLCGDLKSSVELVAAGNALAAVSLMAGCLFSVQAISRFSTSGKQELPPPSHEVRGRTKTENYSKI